MAILWCGGEDLDFIGTIGLGGTYCRTTYARCGITSPYPGVISCSVSTFGPITSGWLSFRLWATSGELWSGLVLSTQPTKGLFLGPTSGNTSKISLYKYNGTTKTALASESGTSAVSVPKLSMQVINYGATATVKVYAGSDLVITYTGDVTVAGVASLDAVAIGSGGYVSEIIVADEDTRLMSLATLAPNAAGDANAWTGTYADINETTTNDATEMYTDVLAQDAQVNLSNLPTGTFTIKAVKIVARTAKSVGSSVGSICLGVKSGGTINPGTPQACDTAWATKERLLTQNPVTANIWQPSEVDALQLNFRSAA